MNFNDGYEMAQADAMDKITDTIVFSPDSVIIQIDSVQFKKNIKKDKKAKELTQGNSDKFI